MPPFWKANAGAPLMVRLPSQAPWPYWLAMYKLIWFFWNLERMYLWLVRCSLCWKPCLCRTVPQTIWKDVSQAIVFSLAQIKLFSIPITVCLLLPLTLNILNILQLCQLFLNKAGGGGDNTSHCSWTTIINPQNKVMLSVSCFDQLSHSLEYI